MKKNSLMRLRISSPRLLISAFAVIVYLILVFMLSRPFTGWLFFSKGDEKGLLSAAKFDPENATYHYLLGRFYHLNIQNPDLEKAAEFYSRSLKLNPLQAGIWINLSKILQTEGKKKEAEYALERAIKLSPRDTDLMWEAGTFWLINSNAENAVSVLRQYLLLRPDKQTNVYDLCYKLGLTNNYLLEKLVPGSYEFRSEYLNYLMRTKRVNETVEVWNSLDQQKIEKDIFISYVNFLISNCMYEKARSVWKEITQKIEGLEGTDEEAFQLWNPGFENEILNGGFDWTINETEGVDVYIDDIIHMAGSRSLGVIFDGNHNPGIVIARQVVMLTPSSQYHLRSYIRTEGLTTRNGILMNIQGHNCKKLSKNSEVVTGTTFWKEVTIDFKTPPECNAVLISFIRMKSSKFDNKIEGTAWIDGIKLKQVTNLPKIISKKP